VTDDKIPTVRHDRIKIIAERNAAVFGKDREGRVTRALETGMIVEDGKTEALPPVIRQKEIRTQNRTKPVNQCGLKNTRPNQNKEPMLPPAKIKGPRSPYHLH
jgi:hypothetical protein